MHWLNENNNLSYYKFYNFISFDLKPGFTNSYGHTIIDIYYYDNKRKMLLTKDEKEKLFSEKKHIPLKTKIINHLINFLYKIQ